MLCTVWIMALAAFFLVVSWKAKSYVPEVRTVPVTRPLSVVVTFVPLAAVAVFAVLFATVLHGRLAERSTHALLVLALWIYATRFYQYILSYYKRRGMFAASVAGMASAIVLAVLLTPLERYVDLIYIHIKLYSVLLGCGALAVFYAAAFLTAKKARPGK